MRSTKVKVAALWIVPCLAFLVYLFPEVYREPKKKPIAQNPVVLDAPGREALDRAGQNYLRDVEPILKKKCFDCHAADFTPSWFYALPGVKQLIDWDIRKARSFIDMGKGYPFAGSFDFMEQLYELETEVNTDGMPLTRYRVMNWGSGLSDAERKIILEWIAASQALLKPFYDGDLQTGAKTGADAFKKDYGRPSAIPFPEGNPTSEFRIRLGRELFFDPRLSGSGKISCASCHDPALYWTDGLPTGRGHEGKILKRHSPTLMNAAWDSSLFWDGRASSLETQALGPIASPDEMNMDVEALASLLNSIEDYRVLFERAYPGEPIAADTIAKALASFERTFVTTTSPFDRWLNGEDGAISDEAKKGLILFNTKANCMKCHSGWRFTDDGFQDIGLMGDDRGRGAVLDMADLDHAFKTPTLRNVARTAPYMHDGSLATLAEVLDFYDRGGDVKRPGVSPDIGPLNLSETEKSAILDFLNSLTEPKPELKR